MKKKITKGKKVKKITGIIPKYKYFIAIMISMFLIILPWISRLKIMNISKEMANVFPNNEGIYIDLFLYYKEIFIISFGVFLLLFFIGEIIFPDNRINNYPLKEKNNRLIIVCAFIYSLTVILSYIFSKYRNVTLFGSPTECEGVIVLVAYMILFLAGLNYFCYEKSINILKKILIIFMTIIIILTLVEFLYKPIFEIAFFQQFLASDKYGDLIKSIKNKDYNGMVSLAMYNPNYFGGLCVLLFPISITNLINEKNKLLRFYLAGLSGGMLFCTIAAKSTASTYIVLAEILFLIILYRKKIIEDFKEIAIYIVMLLAIFITINIASDNKLVEVSISALINKESITNNKEKFKLKDITLDGYLMRIDGNNDSLIIRVNEESDSNTSDFKFYNKDEKEILPIVKEDMITFIDEEFKAISIKNLQYGIVVDIGYNDTMEFYITEEGFRGVGQNGAIIDNIKRDEIIFPELYSIATGRGYTWVNTLPLLKKSIFLGTGPGTFAMNFQQNDYVGLMNTHGSAKFVIDKPHSMYLQIATQTGVIGLIALLVIFSIAIIKSIKVYLKPNIKSNTSEYSLGIGIFIGILGFLIVSLVNDSIVTVNPIFWILLGVNFSILHTLNEKVEI